MMHQLKMHLLSIDLRIYESVITVIDPMKDLVRLNNKAAYLILFV